jgi:hypothetical protein
MNKLRVGYIFQGDCGETIIFENEEDVKSFFYTNYFQDYDFEYWFNKLPSEKKSELTEESAYALFKFQAYMHWYAGWVIKGIFYRR